jgi:hypothetical protein
MSTDEASFIASITPQSVDEVSPFTEKNYNFVSDVNSGVYSGANTGQTQINFDLSSLYNSSLLVNAEDCYLAIPLVTCAQHVQNGVVRAPPGAGHALVTLKNGFHHLVNSADITSGGVTIQESQPFLNVIKHFKLISQMSATDLQQSSSSYGMSDCLDTVDSQKWLTVAGKGWDGTTNATGTLPGVGLTNNQAFLNGNEVPLTSGGATATVGVGPSAYSGNVQTVAGVKGAYTVNEALQKRIARLSTATVTSTSSLPIASASNVAGSNIYGAPINGNQPFIMSSTDLNTEFKSYYTTVGNTMVWYDLAYIKCSILFGAFETMGLSRKLDLQMRLFLNSGSLAVPLTLTTAGYMQYGVPTSNTFTYTCPFTVNTLPILASSTGAGSATDGWVSGEAVVPPTAFAGSTGYLAVGCFPVRAPTTSIGSLSVNFNGIAHSMTSTRFYYSQIKMSPERTLKYITENRAKRCLFQSYIFNQYNAIPAGGNFSQLVQAGCRNLLGLICLPLISSSQPTLVGGSTALGFSQYQSPYDQCPSTGSAISLTNFQVSVGGAAVFKSGAMQYSFENFVENVALFDSIVPGLGPASSGIFTQKDWEASRVYFADLSRAENADKASQRNLSISFRNNSQVICDILVFTLYSTEILLDVETGRTQML